MKMHKIEMGKSDFMSLPANEKVFLIYAGHTLNELNIFCRLIVLAMPLRRGEAERQFMVIQSMLLLRTLAGKLHEMWVLFNKTYYKSKLSLTMKGQLSQEVEDALKTLKDYFNKETTSISTIRNKHAFHYDVAQVDTGLAKLPEKWRLDIYFDRTSTNTFYGFSDSIINSAVTASIDSDSPNIAFEMLFEDTQMVAKSFQTILEGIIAIVISKRLANRLLPENVKSENVLSSNWRENRLPTFVEDPAPWSVTLQNGRVLSWAGQNMDSPAFLCDLITE
ncbi:hypothetical protein [Massilia oculi]|uniref:hypothetical protein n=1 Tax=Massilia oculi TaxID=945844 RepID=UPI0028AEC229|nr:hypothetical protein [Massilia oculi]